MDDSSLRHDQQRRKAELRARLLAARRGLVDLDPPAEAVRATLRTLLPRRGGAGLRSKAVVAAYAPFGTEPGGRDLPAVLAAALGPTGRLILPVVRRDLDLDWVEYDGSTPPPGPRVPATGDPAPGARLGRAAIARAALVVVPALAVDRRGVRLGRGGGSYDRALARVPPEVPVVALLHEGELIDGELPTEPHDRRVSAVVTPSGGLVALSRVGWTEGSGRVHH